MKNRKYNTKGRPTGSVIDRFWAKVKKSGENDCWEWFGAKSTSGYGVIQKGKRGEGLIRTHRLSYEIHNGPISDRELILHSCDNKICCNPKHLSAGDYSRNITEAWARGRRKLSNWNLDGFPKSKASKIRSRIRFTV